MQNLFLNLFNDESATLSVGTFLLCLFFGFLIGGMYFAAFSFKNKGSKSFRIALLLLPSIVAVVIMMVNGSIGVGVAIAGAFSLVRFRSAQGSAKEIAVIFMSMCSGLILGVGYVGYAFLFTLVMCASLLVIHFVSAAREKKMPAKLLRISIPENLDYESVFDDLFETYASKHQLTQVRSAGMGSIFKLSYEITLKSGASEKAFLDDLRTRNGNLEVFLGRPIENANEL